MRLLTFTRQSMKRFGFATTLAIMICGTAFSQSTTFPYQGRLTDGGSPATGNYDFQFALWDSLSGGTQIGLTVTLNTVAVSNGVFTASLDFGADSFTGASRFLEIAARPVGAASFTTLSPRQQISSTPYAIRTLNATAADGLSSACVNCVQDSQINALTGSKISGAIPMTAVPAGSGNYIQNSTSQQASSNFDISGDGTVGGTFSGNIVNAAQQFNINGNRVLSIPGNFNLFVGRGAGTANTGNNNVFVGTSAGRANTTGGSNSFFGTNVGIVNDTGGGNAFFGFAAGNGNTSGSENSFFGYSAGRNNTVSDFNSLFGAFAGSANNTGSANSSFGYQAGSNNSSGDANSFFGFNAGLSNTTENNNTFLGSLSNGAAAITNATAVGANASVTQSNSLVLGSINGINQAQADTRVGIGTTAPSFKLDVSDPGSAGLRVQSNTAGGTVALFGTRGNFRIDGGSSGSRFIVGEDGKVGIGIAAPTSLLHIVGATPFAVTSGSGADALPVLQILGGNGGATLDGSSSSSGGKGGGVLIQGGDGGNGSHGPLSAGKGGSITLQPGKSGLPDSLSFYGSVLLSPNYGNVGIGTSSPLSRLHVVGGGPVNVRISDDNATQTSISLENSSSSGQWRLQTVGNVDPNRSGNFEIAMPGLPVIDVTPNLNVGIGTFKPATLLDVAGNAFVRGSGTLANNPGAADLQVGYGLAPAFTAGSVARLALQPYGHTGGPWRFIARDDATKAYLDWVYGTHPSGITQDSSGFVGIGTLAPDVPLSVNGAADKPGGGSWATFSDERLKNIRGRFTPGLNAVMRLQPLRYEYKPDNALGIKSEGEHIGFSAQQVQKIIPEAVTKNDKGYLLVNNDPILWTMLNAIKEQQAQMQSQQKEIQQLRQEVKRLRSATNHGRVRARRSIVQSDASISK